MLLIKRFLFYIDNRVSIPQLVAAVWFWNLLWNHFKPLFKMCLSLHAKQNGLVSQVFALHLLWNVTGSKCWNIRVSGDQLLPPSMEFQALLHPPSPHWIALRMFFSLNECHSINVKPKRLIQSCNRLNWNITFTHFNSLNHFESMFTSSTFCFDVQEAQVTLQKTSMFPESVASQNSSKKHWP